MRSSRRHPMRRAIWGDVGADIRRTPYLVVWVAVLIVIIVATSWWSARIGRPFLSGLILGGGAGVVAYVGLWALSYLGYMNRLHGVSAELETRKVLGGVPSEWQVRHNVMVGSVDVDHVVIAPGRVYCIESKWSSALRWAGTLDSLAKQAERRAIAFQQAHPELVEDAETVPILMIHGHARGRLKGPKMIGETRIVHFSHDLVGRMRRAVDQADGGGESVRGPGDGAAREG